MLFDKTKIQKKETERERYFSEKNKLSIASPYISPYFLFFFLLQFLFVHNIHAAETLKDVDISRAVETNLIFDESIPFHLIDVKTNKGVVTLSGSVDTLFAKRRAVTVAETIKGVTAIVDLIEVKPIKRSDIAIKNDVSQALLKDPATDLYEIDVSVQEGIVSLSGVVDSWAEKTLSEEVASQVKGVKNINVDGILINTTRQRSDYEISQDVSRSLDLDAYVDSALVEASVKDGAVYLSGIVGSLAEKNRVWTTAFNVLGVKEVHADKLEIKYWLRDKMRRKTSAVYKSDEDLKKVIKNALTYDPRLTSFDITVDVASGVVYLGGVVDNYSAKMAAKKDAENSLGVFYVQNFIKVRPENYARAEDSDIALDILSAFNRDYLIEADNLVVTVKNKKAILRGNLNTVYEKKHAEEVASNVPGVVAVENNLIVTPTLLWVSDVVIQKNIQDELFWSAFVDSDNITVTVTDSIASLTGKVSSWSEFKAAVNNAFEGGAKSVKASLAIEGLNQTDDVPVQQFFYPFDHYYVPF